MPRQIGGEKCLVCGDRVPDLHREAELSLETQLVPLIQAKHPKWVLKNGVCPSCVNYYRNTLNHANVKTYLGYRVAELHHGNVPTTAGASLVSLLS